MATRRDELKAKLLAKSEAAIDELLKDERLHERMTMSEIEQVVGAPEAAFRQAALEEIIALQMTSSKVCPLCGGTLENKGKRPKQVVTRRGETRIERTYYQCQHCGRGYFPPR
jgi:YgiT-type zinc finger domain-containing protein